MLGFIRNWLRPGPQAPVVTTSTTMPMKDPLVAAIERGECPDCGSREFYFGPEGGCSQNIKCANDACGSRFNVGFFPGGRTVERIGYQEKV